MNNFSNFQSPFSWRYGSDQMRRIFSEENKYRIWRKIWVSLARAQYKQGLVSKKELDDLKKYQDDIDIKRILKIEEETRHDVVAAIREFAEKARIGGGKIHLGATSMDITDNTDALRICEAVDLVGERLKELLNIFSQKIDEYAKFPCMGYTHLQPAEPTTLGYRFSFYAQDLLTDFALLRFIKGQLKGKGMKGAVGTSAAYIKLLDERRAEVLEKEVMDELGLEIFDITSQTYPRKMEFLVGFLLSSIAQSLYKFAFDLRVMQSPGFGEWQEPFGNDQVGSSAMPFKKNPIKSEQICSLARFIVNLSRVTWDNASGMILERTLDDSANRRAILPEIFLATEEILNSATSIVKGLIVNQNRIRKNLQTYWPFSAVEAIIVETVKKGADRQRMHEVCRRISMEAWQEIQNGGENPMKDLLLLEPQIGKYLSDEEVENLWDFNSHVGQAPQKSKRLARKVRILINSQKG